MPYFRTTRQFAPDGRLGHRIGHCGFAIADILFISNHVIFILLEPSERWDNLYRPTISILVYYRLVEFYSLSTIN